MAEIRKQTSSKLIVQVVGAGLPKLESVESTESPKKYFLFIGGDIERKNLNFLIPIWGEIFESTRYRLVVVVGEKSASLKINDLADIEGITYVINPNNMQLATLYQGSRALLWPSLAEGFGMPLLEAMSFGKSFISTSVGAAKELRTGESKILPLDASLWRDKIVQTISHPQTDHSDQIHKAHEYTWENVAKNVKKAIDSFLL
jgi:glycosyltransferase involved in cell wall biosynthesis